MKKIISIVLVLIMVVSVVPTAFAADASQREAYIAEAKKCFVYTNSVFDSPETFDAIFNAYKEIADEYDFDIVKDWIDENEESLPVITEKIKAVTNDIEAKIESGEYTVVIDSTEFLDDYCDMLIYNDYDDVEQFLDSLDKEIFDKAMDSFDTAYEMIDKGYADPTGVNQEDFDIAAKDAIAFFKAVNACFSKEHNCTVWTDKQNGNHSSICDLCGHLCIESHVYGEYVSNNDATEEADGTKTAVCEKCGEENTVVDKGSQLIKEPASFIEKLIEFIKNLFAKIFAIFG